MVKVLSSIWSNKTITYLNTKINKKDESYLKNLNSDLIMAKKVGYGK